ncbi:MAG TPA: type VI secretion protein IcmF/TssM N-terminal domain-containing protein [Lacipirellulaceae bacterium]|nr:type VI secretion protein IcmF/TssM N-terminal domain-containing protein [Lacipirellulaceae bacterium]
MAKKPAKPKPAVEEPPPEEEDDAEEQAPPPLPPPPPQVSVPARASCLTFLVLLLAELIILVVVWFTRESMPFRWPWFIGVNLLIIIIPIVVYRAVALWMFDEVARFPDIATAWRTGIAELQRQGLSLDSAPLFLVLGTGNDKLRRNFMSAADREYRVDGGGDSALPIYWYANEDAIFLYLNDVSWTNAAITMYEIHAAAVKGGQQLPGEVPQAAIGGRKAQRYLGTLLPGAAPAPAQHSPRPDLPSDAAAMERMSPSPAPKVKAQGPMEGPRDDDGGGNYFQTISPDQILRPSAPAARPQAAPAPITGARPAAAGQRVSHRLSSQASGHQLQRLENVCGMLRRHRHPVCPVNGILSLLPFEMLKAGAQDVAELERAISADLTTIYRELQLRCPVTAVVVGMEQERGFREMIRRIGREGATKQRFGQRFDLRVPATEEELRKFSSHVCGTFEDWVYTLFRDEQALSHPGNTYLYALLCKVRRTMKQRLGDVLGKGFGYREHTESPVLFSGCYFAATGPKSDRQAFVSGLLSKLYDEQEDIEWTPDAIDEDRRRGLFATIGWIVCAVILIATGVWFLIDRLNG